MAEQARDGADSWVLTSFEATRGKLTIEANLHGHDRQADELFSATKTRPGNCSILDRLC